jgi:hypothetical protein
MVINRPARAANHSSRLKDLFRFLEVHPNGIKFFSLYDGRLLAFPRVFFKRPTDIDSIAGVLCVTGSWPGNAHDLD